MSYLREVAAWLDAQLSDDGLLDTRLHTLDAAKVAELKTEVKSKILESYRNGQRDCEKCNPKRHRGSAQPRR